MNSLVTFPLSLVLCTGAHAQATDQAPFRKPSSSPVIVTASAPRYNSNYGVINILVMVRSLSDETLPIAVDSNYAGFDAFASTHGSCGTGHVQSDVARLVPPAHSELTQNGNPNDFTAGPSRAAQVQLTFPCKATIGDEVTYSARFYVHQNGRWAPYSFGWERQVLQ